MLGSVLIISAFSAWVIWLLWLLLGMMEVRTSRAALLSTAIPPTLLAIAALVFALLNKEALGEGPTINIFWQVGFGLAVAAFLSSFVFAIMRKWEIAKGTDFGSSIGIFALLIDMVLAFFL
jgi:hypothetical protein